MFKNELLEGAYSLEAEKSALSEILSCLWYVTPRFVSRAVYEDKTDDILVQTGENEFASEYDIFLPENIRNIELLKIIDILNTEFDISHYARFDELLVSTKTAVVKFLKEGGTWEEKEKYIEASGISKDLQNRIKNVDIRKHTSAAKTVLRGREKWLSLEEVISDIYWEEFEKTFFRNGINVLRLGLMTFTKEDHSYLLKKKRALTDRTQERSNMKNLDDKEVLLRDKIWIDEWKNKLNSVREDWNIQSIARLELEVSKLILKTLQEYPYQSSKGNWGSINNILENKEIQCVGFSIIAHALFRELWIEHKGLHLEWHSALEITIWWKQYYFDASMKGAKIEILNYTDSFKFPSKGVKNVGIWESKAYDIENVLMSQLYCNYWQELRQNWSNEKAIKMYNKAIELSPEYGTPYVCKAFVLAKIWRYKDSALNFLTYFGIEENWLARKAYYLLPQQKKVILDFVEREDFIWLHKYVRSYEW